MTLEQNAHEPEPPPRMLGVLGGMGPLATAEFYRRLVLACPAKNDQEHIPVVIWADPSVPDRSNALMGAGADPTPALRRGAQALKRAGATSVVVPCNTAHVFLDRALDGLDLPVVSLVEATTRHIARFEVPGPVGILGTSGTVASQLYQDALAKLGIATIVPDTAGQELADRGIRSVKAGDARAGREALVAGMKILRQQGATRLIAGCTEIIAAWSGGDARDAGSPDAVLIDPVHVVIEELVESHLRGYARA
ncbi:aspartate/glutamate racemase family protein [Leucobacter sp. M11]|uniref:aspartate/glutamate racemase family protein n=1 Tax=Leucobacter sp. M11 TaxID=2993565 RepID=UPI002D7E5F26|nr:amino acid racemase [Leucobacter sp. M11]MEB4614460.1 amino acid racemase [Leucobacter sp. M11]